MLERSIDKKCGITHGKSRSHTFSVHVSPSINTKSLLPEEEEVAEFEETEGGYESPLELSIDIKWSSFYLTLIAFMLCSICLFLCNRLKK